MAETTSLLPPDLPREAQRVMAAALHGAVSDLSDLGNGLLVRLFPTERLLGPCIQAAADVLRQGVVEGVTVIIGSRSTPPSVLPPHIRVFDPHRAAAAATKARNEGQRVLYLCEVDSPGASGVDEDVLRPLPGDKIAAWYAEAGNLGLLGEAANSAAHDVRRRLTGLSVEDLACYGLAVGSEDRSWLRQMAAFPLLGLVPDKLSGDSRVKPNSSWARSFESLDGAALAKNLREARRVLRSLAGDQKEEAGSALLGRLLPREFCVGRDPVDLAAELAGAAARFAEGDISSQPDLIGVSRSLLQALKKGEEVLSELRPDEPPPDDPGDPPLPPPPDDPKGLVVFEGDDLGLLGRDLESRDLDWSCLHLSPGEDDPPSITLLTRTKPNLSAWLARSVDGDFWRRGGAVSLEDPEPFLSDVPPDRDWSFTPFHFREEITAGLSANIRASLGAFLGARAALIEKVAGFAPPVGDPRADAAEADPPGDADAVVMLEAFPLTAATHARAECEAYIASYARFIEDVAQDAETTTTETFLTWLVNLDLAIQEPSGVNRARLLPLHPLKIERSLLHLSLGSAPPDHPATLVTFANNGTPHLSAAGGDRFIKVERLCPTARGLVGCAEMGLSATWHLLSRLRLCRSVRVELQSLSETTAVINALGSSFMDLGAAAPDRTGGAHLEVVFPSEGNRAPVAYDFDQLSEEVNELLRAVPGSGLSMSIKPQSVQAAAVHLLVREETCRVYSPQQPPVSPDRSGRWLSYEPGPQGNIRRVLAHGTAAAEARRRLDAVVGGSETTPYAVHPPSTSAWQEGALVRAVTARRGWPVDPSDAEVILAYDIDRDDNYIAVLGDPEVLRLALEEEFEDAIPAIFDQDSGVTVTDLREASLVLYGMRGAQLRALASNDSARRRLRGDLGELMAFVALRAEYPPSESGSRDALIVDLNGPSGMEWAETHGRLFGKKCRADLLVLERTPEGSEVARLRVIELKTRGAAPTTADARRKLASQAIIIRARVHAAFDASAADQDRRDNAEGLRRILWLEAGRQLLAKDLEECLVDLDQRVIDHRSPEVTAECWVVPDAPWHGEGSFPEEMAGFDLGGNSIEEAVEVSFRILSPIPKPMGGGSPRPASTGEGLDDGPVPGGSGAAEDTGGPPLAPTSGADSPPHPPQEVQDEEGQAHHRREKLNLFLGATKGGRQVEYSPDDPENRHIMVTGSSGMGKTQLLKSVILQLRSQGILTIVLDFKNDYASDEKFCEAAELERIFVRFDGLPYNPLIPPLIRHPATREEFISVSSQVQGLSATLRATYGLGVQQENCLKDAMRLAYSAKGIDPHRDQPKDKNQEYPDFSEVGAALKEADAKAYARLDPLFDLDLFRPAFSATPFDDLLGSATVLDLSQLPNDQVKEALARIFIISAHAYYSSEGHSAAARQFFVFDEAHRMKDEEKLLQFVRECRAYGVGVLLSSQMPGDFKPEVSAQLATKLVHGNGSEAAKVNGIVNLLGIKGREGEVRDLQKFQIAAGSSKLSPTFLRTLHYPALAVYRYLCGKPGGVEEPDVTEAPGLIARMTSPSEILAHLDQLGLAEQGPDGLWRALRSSLG